MTSALFHFNFALRSRASSLFADVQQQIKEILLLFNLKIKRNA